VPLPGGSKRVQDQTIFHGQFFRVQDDHVGVADAQVSGDAPGFVTNDTGAVNTSGGIAILVAVEDARTMD
jgi:hypothetical protein